MYIKSPTFAQITVHDILLDSRRYPKWVSNIICYYATCLLVSPVDSYIESDDCPVLNEGADAMDNNVRIYDCPYPKGTTKWRIWLEGWMDCWVEQYIDDDEGNLHDYSWDSYYNNSTN